MFYAFLPIDAHSTPAVSSQCKVVLGCEKKTKKETPNRRWYTIWNANIALQCHFQRMLAVTIGTTNRSEKRWL